MLPCGAKLVIRFGGHSFLTEVIDNRLKASGRQFEVTEHLAEQMGLDGTQRIEWRFASRGGPRPTPGIHESGRCSTLCVVSGFNVNQHTR